jgi:hypothetical protein
MRLDSFLLADGASAHDGKLYLLGGGVTRINPPQLPWIHPQLALVLRLRFDHLDDVAADHTVGVSLWYPDGSSLLAPPTFPLQREQPTTVSSDEEIYLHFVLNLGGLPLVQEGTYRIEIALDDEVVREMALPVVLVPQSTTELSN